jgi:hypothetical protein
MILMRVSLSRTLASRRPSNVRNTALEPSGRSTDGGWPEVTPITSMRPKATCARVRIAAALMASLILIACNQPPQLVSTTVPGPFAVNPSPVPTDTTERRVSALAVPAPATPETNWAPAPRTKTTGCSSVNGLPDSACTPRAADPRVN